MSETTLETLPHPDIARTPLPEGYQYAEPGTVAEADVAELLRCLPDAETIPDDYLSDRQLELDARGLRAVDIAVQADNGELAGFGSLIYDEQSGLLCDFAVSPAYQHQGVGKAIILERLRLAEDQGMPMIEIPSLELSNTLRNFYIEQGFQEMDDYTLRRGAE